MARELGRREFLSGCAVAGAAVALRATDAEIGNGAGTKQAPSVPIRLGVASYSFRKFGRADLIQFMHELNTSYLNVKDVHLPMGTPAEIKQASDEFTAGGITLTAAGTIYFTKDDDDDMRRKFDYCRIADVPVMVAGPTPEVLPRMEKFAKAYDMKIAIHNHGPEDNYFPSPLDVLKAVKRMDPRMGICLDVGHAARAGTDVPSAIRTVGRRLYDVHMKDLADTSSKESQVAVGDGVLPVENIFAALIAVRYAGYVDLEYEIHEDDPVPGMRKSLAFMRGVLVGMGYKP
jgi:sugar phosphate isomerase/epimerase